MILAVAVGISLEDWGGVRWEREENRVYHYERYYTLRWVMVNECVKLLRLAVASEMKPIVGNRFKPDGKSSRSIYRCLTGGFPSTSALCIY